MVVITQANPYLTISRKIGYSVGLESLNERVFELVKLYDTEKGLSFASFTNLVEKTYARKNAVEHFANFYGTLNLVRLVGRDIEPLFRLDTLAILRRLFLDDEPKFLLCQRIILTLLIIEADGDVFLNGLFADFKPNEMKTKLEAMSFTKIQRLQTVFPTKALLAQMASIINIKNQTQKNAISDEKLGRFEKRKMPLEMGKRTTSLDTSVYLTQNISEDYLDKTSKTRKGWAQDLLLFKGEKRTAIGDKLLSFLFENIVSTDIERSCILYWGYKSDLDRIRVDPSKISAISFEEWDLISQISKAYKGETSVGTQKLSDDQLYKLFLKMHQLYREASSSRGSIRNSLPLYIAEPILAAYCVAKNIRLPDINAYLKKEFTRPVRRIQRMIIRGTLGALYFMKE